MHPPRCGRLAWWLVKWHFGNADFAPCLDVILKVTQPVCDRARSGIQVSSLAIQCFGPLVPSEGGPNEASCIHLAGDI